MEHRDHMENVGKLGPGDVQWMKAGSGVIHSEMPQQEEGRMRGFQLWVNLPAEEKMTPATYNDISAADIPGYEIGDVAVKAIAGDLAVNGTRVPGKVRGLSTEPAYLDISVKSEQTLGVAIPDGHNTLVYVYEGELRVAGTDYPLRAGMLGRLSHSGVLELNVSSDTRLLVISGKPIGEPIVHYGPFVMNSVEEIQQAIQDYQSGRLVSQAGA
jgi:redox-sensitive bicupin YhaK (pirin superfamily)